MHLHLGREVTISGEGKLGRVFVAVAQGRGKIGHLVSAGEKLGIHAQSLSTCGVGKLLHIHFSG